MGAPVGLLRPIKTFMLALLILMMLLSSFPSPSFGVQDSDNLLKFKQSLNNTNSLSNWNASVGPCNWNRPNWAGVLCLNGKIWGLQLESMGLSGNIDVDALFSLPNFRTLSLMNNKFDGPLPDMGKLGSLKALYLSNNMFSGEIPDDAFEGMGTLRRLFLANNEFTGKIPSSLTTLPRLAELRLEGNQFEGQIPEFEQRTLKTINFASNELEGAIPSSLSKMSPSSFSGNKGLCGPPLDPCGSEGHKRKSSNLVKVIIINIFVVIILVAIVVALILLLLLLCRKKRQQQLERTASSSINDFNKMPPSYSERRGGGGLPGVPERIGHMRGADRGNKLSFVRDDVEKFDLQELLRASAEVLGSGAFGASYKAVVLDGLAVVVKRFRHMNNVGKEEFHEHMRRIGRLRHPNLLPLAAYYYRKEEKLLVSEFVENGTLATHLHGNHLQNDHGLDWHRRVKIIKGVARGLAYLCNELPIMVPHGHLKSSNVLLDHSFEPLLTDYTLRPVINPEHAHTLMMAYKSPEYAQHGRTSDKTDVWCFGILILEILTGKFPENCLTQGYDRNADLATWVNNMVKKKRTSEVFDKDVTGTKNSKGEMITLLKIGLSCCEEDVDRRLSIKEVVEQLAHLKEGYSDEEYYGSEGNAFSVRGIDDDFSYTVDR